MERNRKIKTVIVALLLIVISMGVAFAALSTTLNITGQAKVNAPNWGIKFKNLSSAIETGYGKANGTPTLSDTQITNVKAIFDGNGSVAYEFDVVNNGSLDASIGTLTINVSPICTGSGTSKTADEALVCDAISTTLKYKTGETVSVGDTLDAGETKRMIFTITYDAGSNHPDNEVTVTGLDATIIYNESTSSGTVTPPTTPAEDALPMTNNLIPIKWNGSNWVKADSTNARNDWYDYDNKIWANAVTVTEATRSTYKDAAVGTPILETDILTYMVWVPRYRYAISSASIGTNNPSEISIIFENKTTPKSTGTGVDGSYLTHPAFTFGDKELDGLWVGKFEMTGSISSLTIKPNLSLVRDQTVSNMFYATRAMQNAGNIYGYDTTGVDTHMMKNTEWGAVAYLSHSKYGQNTEITINSSTFTSGNAGSTTGNIYGIYDMSGGAWEYVMGNYKNTIASSGFDATWFTENSKYYDLYTETTALATYNGGMKGDALYETAGWYGDYTTFATTTYPWVVRGGVFNAGTGSGSFSFSAWNGYTDGGGVGSWRLVQTE